MAVLKLKEAQDARVKQEIDPIVAALNAYLSSARVVDYFSNAAIENHVVFFGATEKLVGATVVISESGKAGLITAIEAAAWKEATVVYNEGTKTLEISFAEKAATVVVPPTGGSGNIETPVVDPNA